MNAVLLIIAAATVVSALIVLFKCAVNAPEGHEEAAGFYLDAESGARAHQPMLEEKELPARSLVVGPHLPVM